LVTEISKLKIAVIGGGPGGYAAAFHAADLGMQVTLINDEANPGGVCLYRGCIPSKALLHVAKLIQESRDAKNWGISFGEPSIDVARLRAFKEGVVRKLTGGLGQLTKLREIEYIQGRASFLNSNTLTVEARAGTTTQRTFDRIIIATGSRPATIPALEVSSPRLLDSTGALALLDVPKTMLVVGGGYIGLELGTVYAALGTRVSVVEMLPGLLMPGADRDLVAPLQKRIEKIFASIMLNTIVAGLKEETQGIRVYFDGAGAQEREQVFDKVLVSVGRTPNSAIPGLQNTRVEVTSRGFIHVNSQLQTAEPTIYAIGDVAGDPMLAHKAAHEGHIAVEHIAGHDVAFQPKAIPAVIFTDPEIAWCGMTEAQAQKEGREIAVSKFPWAASGRATTLDRTEGMTKLILDPATEAVLGMGIVGPEAGEMIAEGVMAVEMGVTAGKLKTLIHAHPTLSETVMEAAELHFGQSSHYWRPKSKSKNSAPVAT
jgi:dihydrolipoamide dehydrogenase